MRAIVVVVADELGQDRARRWRSLRGISWSRHSRRTLCTHRSAYAFARGARGGILTGMTPSDRRTSSNAAVNLESRSRTRILGDWRRSPRCQDRLRLLCDPGPVRVGSAAGEEDPSG
jgi:hypothetical protein